jgi:nucleotide-binding universal stress UspA family protein
MFKRILVPIDGSPTSTKALVTATQMARDYLGQLLIVNSLDEYQYAAAMAYAATVMEAARQVANDALANARAIAQSAGVEAEIRLLEAPGRRLGEVIADEARRWNADMIVVGTHGRRGMSRVLLGSGAEQVIRLAPVPVLVVRGSEETDQA